MTEADKVMAEINKELGQGALIWGSKLHDEHIPRISCGSLSLDIALGGGFTVNSWHEVYGDESSAKTTVILKTIAAQQAEHKDWMVFWCAAEQFVPEWASLLGCDLSRIMILRSNSLEETADAIVKMMENRTVDCVVIDSLPAMSPTSEQEAGMDDQQPAVVARLLGKMFRKANVAMRRSLTEADRPVTGFVVNQWREKIGVMWGDPRTTPGGRAKNYWYFTRVELKRDDWITEGDKKNAHQVGMSVKALVKKNKTAPPGRTASFDFYFDHNEAGIPPGSYDPTRELLGLGQYFDVIKTGGGHYKYDDRSWHGRAALEADLRSDAILCSQLRDTIIFCALKGPLPTEDVPAKRVRLT